MEKATIIIIISFFVFVSCSSASKVSTNLLESRESKNINQITIHDSIINYGAKFLNTPYRYGGSTARGFDCSGFTSHVFKEFGYDLSRSSRDQAKQFPSVKRKDLAKGDLVFFTGRSRNGVVGHVGIVTKILGNGEFEFLHASVSNGVIFSKSTEVYYASRYLSAGRPIEQVSYLARNNVSDKTPEAEVISEPVRVKPLEYIQEELIHTVRRGESLSRIAIIYDVPVNTIKKLNALKSNRIKQGQKLLITEGVKKPEVNLLLNENGEPVAHLLSSHSEKANEDLVEQASTPIKNTHLVKRGESLYSISKQYNCTINQLKEWNQLSNNTLRIGQKLLIH